VNVLSVEDISKQPTIVRDIALIKVKAPPEKRSEVLQLCQVFRARALDVGPDTLVVEVTGTQDKIEGLLAILEPFGVLEMVQSGTVAMTRGAISSAAKQIAQERPRIAVA
jgi:acetolactate synthase-1/3 small subunit